METKISIVQFLFSNDWKVLSDSLGANPALSAHKFSTAPDVLKFCATEESCLVIVNIASKEDLIQLATFFKTAKRSLRNTILKVVVVNATGNKHFEKAISKLGSVEILEPNVNTKALRFKMDFWMKAMRGQAKKLGAMNQKTIEASAAETSANENKTFVQVPPIENENDMWILPRESDCKKIIGRWIVKLMGPGPYVGQWNDVQNKPGVWTFALKKNFSEQFLNGQGSWFYKGEQKPEFNWQENRWMFTGENFDLFFFDGNQAFSRVKLSNKVLTLAGNSLYAKTKEQLILDSFDKELVFSNEAEVIKDQSLDFENEGDLGGHLEGKVKDKEVSAKDRLQGKVKDREEAQGQLEGEIKDKEAAGKGHLRGNVKEKEESSDDLEGKLKNQDASLKGHLSGKVKEKEDSSDDLKGSLKTSSEAKSSSDKKPESPEKTEGAEAQGRKKHSQSNDQLESNWKGKLGDKSGSQDKKDEHKQHNEKLSNQWGGDNKEYSGEEKSRSRNPELTGKNDTDKLKSHWGGKSRTDSVNSDGFDGPGGEDHKEGSLLDLKKTDRDFQTHYKGHNEATKYEAGELGRHQHSGSGPESDGLDGKTSTDRLASHYGKENNHAEGEKSANGPLGGKSGTEKLSGHLSGRRNIEKSDNPEKQKGHYSSPANKKKDSASADIDDVSSELEAAIDSPKGIDSASNVLPFPRAAEEAEIAQLTASTSMSVVLQQNGRKFDCSLDDYFDNNVLLICSVAGLTNSEKAILDIKLDYQNESARINCEGLLTSVDSDDSGNFFVTVEINPADSKMFDHFMDLLRSRQQNIHSFMAKARGIG